MKFTDNYEFDQRDCPAPPAIITHVDGKPYYVSVKLCAVHFLAAEAFKALTFGDPENPRPFPISVCVFNDRLSASPEMVSAMIESWRDSDDVFSWPGFTRSILIFVLDPQVEDPAPHGKVTHCLDCIPSLANSAAVIVEGHTGMRSGPHFLSLHGIHQTWRLFPDPVGAFTCPVVPRTTSGYAIPECRGIPVPSRCYFEPPSAEKPLSGLRVALKDIIDLEGVPTGAGSKVYRHWAGPAEANATVVKKLHAAGAVIVGKTKTVQFASGARAKDWVDYKAPLNARDHSQEPGCSSAGAASAIAAYPWLDISVGSDTLGSITGPAALQGVFGLRPSQSLISTKGVVPVSEHFDTIGVLTRDVATATAAVRALAEDKLLRHEFASPIEILVPMDILKPCAEDYVNRLDQILSELRSDVQIKSVNTVERWCVSIESVLYDEYLKDVVADIQLRDCYLNAAEFHAADVLKLDSFPKVDPIISHKWSLGANVSSDRYWDALKKQEAFRKLVCADLLRDVARTSRVLILPVSNEVAKIDIYEQKSLDESASLVQGYGWNPHFIPVLAGLPFLIVPIDGEYVTGNGVNEPSKEVRNCIGLVGPIGSELTLLELARLLGYPAVTPVFR